MFRKERLQAIENRLLERGKIRVRELGEEFAVTEDCIRKDLKLLENAGKLKRTYGGAILPFTETPGQYGAGRTAYYAAKKRIIAKKASELIRDHETVYLDISTTNTEIAKLLVAQKKKVVVVSNMLEILQITAAASEITTIGTGGILYESPGGFLGSAAMEMIRQYSFDRAFLGSGGVDLAGGFVTTRSVEDGLTKRAVLGSSRHAYVVMEREKFHYSDAYRYAAFSDIDGIITDEPPEETVMQTLAAAGVDCR